MCISGLQFGLLIEITGFQSVPMRLYIIHLDTEKIPPTGILIGSYLES